MRPIIPEAGPALRRLGLALLLLASGCARAPLDSAPESEVPTIPAYSAQSLQAYAGQIIVLNFWAAWCAPCRQEMPALEAAYQKYRHSGAVVIGVNVSESAEEINSFVKQEGLSFPVFRDPAQQAARSYNIRILPTTLFFDRSGEIRTRRLGGMTETFLSETIEALLD